MDITRDTTEEEKRKRVVLALVLSSYLVVGIDGSLVITAIAEIASDLHLGDMAMSWVQNAYVLAFGGFMLAGGRLGDIYGRKRLFCISIVLFCIGSLGAGLSQTASLMIVSRFAQGVGSAAMAPHGLLPRERKGESRGMVWQHIGTGTLRRVGAWRRHHELRIMAMGLFGQHSPNIGNVCIRSQMAA